MGWPKEAFLHLRQIVTPNSRPSAGGNLLYVKADNGLYLMDADGTERAVGGTETLPASIIDAKGDLIVGTAADTAARLPVGADGTTLAAYSIASAGVEWVPSSVPAILLSYGDSVPADVPAGTLVYWKKQVLSSTTWDFRNLSSLPAGWARRTVTTESFGPTGMTAGYNAGWGHYYALGTTAASGTFEVKFTAGTTSGSMTGAQIFDTAHTIGASTAWYHSPSGALVLGVNSSHGYDGSFSNAGGTPGYPVWFRIRYDSGSAYGSYSTNGTSWSAESSLARGTMTGVDELSIGNLISTGSFSVTTEYASWSPAGAAASGGLQGWWDGSAVVSFS